MKDFLTEIRKELESPELVENKGPCWPGYKQVGTKMKNGKQVPNCVPIDEADMAASKEWKRKLKKIKGLTKQQMQILSTLPTPVITNLINQIGMVVSDMSEETDAQRKAKFASGAAGGPNSSSRKKKMKDCMDEGSPLVSNSLEIVDSILDKIRDDIGKLIIRSQAERAWPKIQMIAKIAGYKVTKKGQQKGKIFRYDIKK